MNIDLLISIMLALVGVSAGSFAGAMVWRLRAAQLREDKEAGETVSKKDAATVEKIKQTSMLTDRSVCLHCGHHLAWYDLIPVVSWLQLGGRCRYCRKKIGWPEFAVEIGVAAFFVLSYLVWPYLLDEVWSIVQLVSWLLAGIGLAILFLYDSRWFLLPDRVMFAVIACGAVFSFASIALYDFAVGQLVNVLIAVTILSGIYYVIYVVSKHQWIGFGDVKLGLALALLLADWQLALLALFLANLIGTILLLPMMLRGRVTRQSHIPFGPFLIAGWLFAGLFGHEIITWYALLTLVAV